MLQERLSEVPRNLALARMPMGRDQAPRPRRCGREGRRVPREEIQGDGHAVAHLEPERGMADDGEEGRLPAVPEQREEEDHRADGSHEDEAVHGALQALVSLGEELGPGESPVPGQGEGDAPRHAVEVRRDKGPAVELCHSGAYAMARLILLGFRWKSLPKVAQKTLSALTSRRYRPRFKGERQISTTARALFFSLALSTVLEM